MIVMIRRLIAVLSVSVASIFVQAVVPVPVGASAAAVTNGWEVKQFTQDDGRVFYARVPTCAPATEQACVDSIAQPRPLVIYSHPAGTQEGQSNATAALNNLAAIWPNVIFVYSVSKGGTLRWDSGICCTYETRVDDVGYLVKAVEQIDVDYGVKRSGVGLMGDSNGGMLSHKAACERPDVFKAAASFAGTYTGPCNKDGVNLAQWHGGLDAVVPYNGGNTWIDGRTLTFPPAGAIGARMSAKSSFTLTAVPGLAHDLYMRPDIYWHELIWLAGKLGS